MGCCESSDSDPKSTYIVNVSHGRNSRLVPPTEVYEEDTKNSETIHRLYSGHLDKDSKGKSFSYSNKSRFSIPRMKELKLPQRVISDYLIQSRRKLLLVVTEAKFLELGTRLIINPGGLEGSERASKDGVVLFGNKSKSNLPNDFNFPDEEKIGERHFEITYDEETDGYYCKDLFGSGLFIKIKEEFQLRNNSIFSFVSSHILVKIPNEAKNNENIIILKVLYGINKGKEYIFDSSKTTKITIGRLPSNDSSYIQFEDENISRVQCTIIYKEEIWHLVDSNGELNSMNGTWFIADEHILIKEGMILRAGTTSFECGFIELEHEEEQEEENINL